MPQLRPFVGPYTPTDSPIAPSEPLGVLYAGKLLEGRDGLEFMAFRGNGDVDFLGELTDPLPVRLGVNGDIAVQTTQTVAESSETARY